jgi:hypothetical protein
MGLPIAPLIGPLLEIGTTIIDRIWPDKDKSAAERAAADLAEMATSMSAIIAEAQSEDPWTSRARPSFLYVMYVMILFGIPMGILSAFKPEVAAAIASGTKAWLGAIPSEMWWLFGTGYLGYAVTREFGKGRKGMK